MLNKMDLLPEDEREQRCQAVVDALHWSGPVFEISALARKGTDTLVHAAMDFIEQQEMTGNTEDG